MIAGAERAFLPVDVPCSITGTWAAILAALDCAVAGKKIAKARSPISRSAFPRPRLIN